MRQPPAGGGECEHHQAGDEFGDRPQDQPDPGADANLGRPQHAVACAEFAEHGADEWPEQQTRQAEEQSHERADQRPDDGPAAGAETLRAERARDKIESQSERADDPDADQPTRPEVTVLIGAGAEQDAAEHERNSRQTGQHGGNHARGDQNRAQQIRHGMQIRPVQHAPL